MSTALGKYQHYKGAIYKVIGNALHTETLEHLTVYTCEKSVMWVRPTSMFNEFINIDGKETPRFKQIESENLIKIFK